MPSQNSRITLALAKAILSKDKDLFSCVGARTAELSSAEIRSMWQKVSAILPSEEQKNLAATLAN